MLEAALRSLAACNCNLLERSPIMERNLHHLVIHSGFSLVTQIKFVLGPVCPARHRPYSAMMRSAHSTKETKAAGLPNFAPQFARSFSVTPRAREQAPQENTGICLAAIFSRNSLSGGQPMGSTASDVAFLMR